MPYASKHQLSAQTTTLVIKVNNALAQINYWVQMA